MKFSESFTRWLPSILMFLFYGASFTCLNFALGYLQVSVVYAVWSGVGIVLIALFGYFVFQEKNVAVLAFVDWSYCGGRHRLEYKQQRSWMMIREVMRHG